MGMRVFHSEIYFFTFPYNVSSRQHGENSTHRHHDIFQLPASTDLNIDEKDRHAGKKTFFDLFSGHQPKIAITSRKCFFKLTE